jgi:hypothetical protein
VKKFAVKEGLVVDLRTRAMVHDDFGRGRNELNTPAANGSTIYDDCMDLNQKKSNGSRAVIVPHVKAAATE